MPKVAVMFEKGNVDLERTLIMIVKIVSLVMLLIWLPVTLWISSELWSAITQPQIMMRWIILFVFPDLVFLVAFLWFIRFKTAVVQRVDADGNVATYFVEDGEPSGGGGGLKKVLLGFVVLILLGILAGGGWWYYTTQGQGTPLRKVLTAPEITIDWQLPEPPAPEAPEDTA